MIRPNKNPLTPDSLAADGIQGADAKTQGPCEAEHSPREAQALFQAQSAKNAAREHLDRYALDTDTPAQGVAEAADLLEAAADSLAPVALSDAPLCAPAGDP